MEERNKEKTRSKMAASQPPRSRRSPPPPRTPHPQQRRSKTIQLKPAVEERIGPLGVEEGLAEGPKT